MQLRLRRLLALALLGLAAAAPPPSPIGRWLTQDKDGVIEIARCGDVLCGRIVGMDPPVRPDGSQPRDPAGRPQCGLEILHAAPDGHGRWEGRITNPDDGSVWRCVLWLEGEGRLMLRGYVLLPLLGRSQTWTRYAGSLGPACRMG